MSNQKIPYKIYLNENEMPTAWYNLRADMKNKPAPLLNPGTLAPMRADELSGVFCEELVQQELDDTTALFPIPEEIKEFDKMYRPSPLIRAYVLEKKLGTPAKIYYKFEGNNTSGSHKLNSAIAQAYYAKEQGLHNLQVFCDCGYSGCNTDRPEYQKMLAAIRADQVSNVVVFDLTRLNRGYENQQQLLLELEAHHVTLHSVLEQLAGSVTPVFSSFLKAGCK